MNAERNDVDIFRLFHWGKEVTIFDKYGNELTNVYMRLVGDAELNLARVFAIRRSAELRKSFEDRRY